MKFIPQSGYIAVTLKTMTKSAAGIYIPDNALTDRIAKATVVSISSSRVETTTEYIPSPFALDDTIVFIKGQGYSLKVDGIDLIILKNEEVLGTIVD